MRKAGDEIVDVRHVREHVVGRDEVGLLALARQAPRPSATPKNSLDDRDALRAPPRRCWRSARRRQGMPAPDVLQQVAVVGRDLDDEAVGRSSKRSPSCRDIASACASHAGEAAEVGVVALNSASASA